MDRMQAARDGLDQMGGIARRQRFTIQLLVQTAAGAILHCEKVLALMFADMENGHDAGGAAAATTSASVRKRATSSGRVLLPAFSTLRATNRCSFTSSTDTPLPYRQPPARRATRSQEIAAAELG